MSDNVIEVREVQKRYGTFTAVDGISFDVKRGELFGLLGPNGAGKTSTIRMIYGFSPLSGGSLRVFGHDITTGWRDVRARLGVCHQEDSLDEEMSVRDNLEIFAGFFGIPRAVARDRANKLLDFFSLENKEKASVRELSGGMMRRLAIARALINEPDLLILDEPTTGLDPQTRHQLWEKLADLKRQGVTIILTTHYMEEAAQLCDRLIIVDHGKILVEGRPRDLVAQFAGNQIIESQGIPRMGTLEDVFLKLTGRELRE